jgi:hypothetical protein
VAPLTSKEIEEWLEQHIRSRMYAALARPELLRAWLEANPNSAESDRFETVYLLQASCEGRHAALRWLLDFIGINDYRGDPKVKMVYKSPLELQKEHATRITDLPGGELMPYSPELHKVSRALTKATSHPTRNSGHEPIPPERLMKVALNIRVHLQETIYWAAKKTL